MSRTSETRSGPDVPPWEIHRTVSSTRKQALESKTLSIKVHLNQCIGMHTIGHSYISPEITANTFIDAELEDA